MANETTTLAGKAAVVSVVLLLLSFGLCGIVGVGMARIEGNRTASLANASVFAGIVCLGLGLIGLVVTFILLIVGAVTGGSNKPATPSAIPPPSPPTQPPPPTSPPTPPAIPPPDHNGTL